MPKWGYDVRPLTNLDATSSCDLIVAIYTPYSKEWAERASALGGTWKRPFNTEAWQFRVGSQEAVTRLVPMLGKILDRIYPDQDGKDTRMNGITLDRSNAATIPSPPPAQEKQESVTTAQIAKAVSEVVTRRVTEQVNQQITSNQQEVERKLGVTERIVSNALGEVHAKLDQVLSPTVVYLTKKDITEVTFEGLTHAQFPSLLRKVQILAPERRNIWIAGPAGSGKTTAARQVATTLKLPFFFNGSIDTEYKLSGFIDAQGRVISTAFRQAWEQGGVYLFDECDGSMASALLAFNAALANGHASFPDMVCKRHPNTVVLAAANTYGWGGTANYVGRAKLDGAFLDRFSKNPWNYDERLERHAALAVNPDAAGWIDAVQGTRRLIFEKKAAVLCSPRRSICGAELLAGGCSKQEVVESQFCDLMEHSAWGMISGYLDGFARAA